MIGLYAPLAVQTAYFLQAVLLGAGLALLYDTLAAVRILTRAGTGLTALCDGLFWLAALVGYFVFTVVWAGGQVRGFLLLGCGMGAIMFRLTLGPIVRAVLVAVLRAAVGAVLVLFHLACRAVRMLTRPLLWVFRQGKEKFSKKIQKKTSIS